MSFLSLEFELPLFSLIFLIILSVIYYSKKRVQIIENECYDRIIIFSFIEIMISTIVHFICATHEPVMIMSNFYSFINFANKVVTTSFVAIFAYFYFYTLVISLSKVREKYTFYKKYINAFILLCFIISLFTKVDLVFLNNVTNVKGTTPLLAYVLVAICLILSLFIAIKNIKNLDKRYYSIFVIIPLMVVAYLITIVVPAIIIYDVIIVIFCYIIFFTIENPDMKLLEELHKSKEISDNANEEKTLFLYNLTQDIKSISSAIDDDADYILDSKNWDETYECARNIKLNSAKFTTMTNELLDVSQIDSANLKVYNEKYNIKNILKQVINVYSDICKNKELKFSTNIDHDIPEELYGDGIGLKEILTTILSNSAKYTDKGYIELSVNTIIKNDICRLIITIEDSGIGIKSEDINKIKVDNKSLSKANKLITLMNGTMIISSDYGIGTKVKIILDQRIEKNENKETSKYDEMFDNIKILSVDDSESGLKIIEKLLKGTNIKIDNANTGKECIDKIKTNKYDLILLDEELTSISGSELLERIKAIRNFNTPVILLTKDNNYEYNEEYKKIGFSDYILKPLKKDTLLKKINEYDKKDNSAK